LYIVFSFLKPIKNPALRQTNEIVDKSVEPILRKIRQIVPSVSRGGMTFDLSAFILLIILDLAGQIVLAL
jgi:uncharacterized protein YggT (Ycf19 family)